MTADSISSYFSTSFSFFFLFSAKCSARQLFNKTRKAKKTLKGLSCWYSTIINEVVIESHKKEMVE